MVNNAHKKENFNQFMSQLKETNASLDFYSDFRKIASNVESISVKLHQLNYLVGKENLTEASTIYGMKTQRYLVCWKY